MAIIQVSNKIVIVAGMGEIGRPLMEILSRVYTCKGIDIAPVQIEEPCSVLHVCYPFQIQDFVGTTIAYIEKYRPDLVIINSTIPVGTTRKIRERASCTVVYSPVRGKHSKMVQDMFFYKKFVAGFDDISTRQATEHFVAAGFRVATFPNPEAGELSKLVETTWLGLLVGWAQEIERMAAHCGATYDDVNSFIKEIAYLPTSTFPGHIGGHCVMPNIALLQKTFSAKFLDAIVDSNEQKERETQVFANRSV
jgi:UDP-N-acetyl-D-mannosaminuronate dehydrogenase